jgi:hypothetical protein
VPIFENVNFYTFTDERNSDLDRLIAVAVKGIIKASVVKAFQELKQWMRHESIAIVGGAGGGVNE